VEIVPIARVRQADSLVLKEVNHGSREIQSFKNGSAALVENLVELSRPAPARFRGVLDDSTATKVLKFERSAS
jgi:hypothetical protein